VRCRDHSPGTVDGVGQLFGDCPTAIQQRPSRILNLLVDSFCLVGSMASVLCHRMISF
jgi:hypothetical protein